MSTVSLSIYARNYLVIYRMNVIRSYDGGGVNGMAVANARWLNVGILVGTIKGTRYEFTTDGPSRRRARTGNFRIYRIINIGLARTKART